MAEEDIVSFSVTPGGAIAPLPLSQDITEDYLDVKNPAVGLTFHVLSSGGSDQEQRPLILLLHGFPELAYSWRKVMPTLASAGYYVVAPDQRGYGRTTGWDDSAYHDTDLESFSMIQYVADMVHLVAALGYSTVRCVVGHDMGSAVASWCALVRPDIFTSCILMSHPFKGPPPVQRTRLLIDEQVLPEDPIQEAVASLERLQPPRKHYKWYNARSHAAEDWKNPPQGLQAFLRGYFHLKSAMWKRNSPHPLRGWTAEELAKLPSYYTMPLHLSMPQTVSQDMQTEDYAATTSWLTDDELDVYEREWSRTGFQGGLNFYRVATGPLPRYAIMYAGLKLNVPCTFVSGDMDWGNHQDPGALESMPDNCSQYRGFRKVFGAGHWPQQEQPGQVVAYVLDFLWKAEQPLPTNINSAPANRQTFSNKTTPQLSQTSRFQPVQTAGLPRETPLTRPARADTPIEPRNPPFSPNTNRHTRIDTSSIEPRQSRFSYSTPKRHQDTPMEPKQSPFFSSSASSRRSGKQRTDTPVEPPMTPYSFATRSRTNSYSNQPLGGSALAVESSARNADVYRQINERSYALPSRKATPFDDLSTHRMSSGDEEDEEEEHGGQW